MKDESANEELFQRYLLGQLSEAEQQRIEQRFFDDEPYYQQLLEVEDELRCAYAQGTFPRALPAQFERRFMIFADERKRLELARDMLSVLPQVSVEEPFRPAFRRNEPERARSRLSWSFGWLNPARRLALAGAALFIVAGCGWLLFETMRMRNQLGQLWAERTATQQQLEQGSAAERARVEQLSQQLAAERNLRARLEQELARRRAPAAPPAHIALWLAPGLVRGGGETKRLVLPPAAQQVRLQLALTAGAHSRYRAVLSNSDGDEIWRRANLRARPAGARQILSLTIPARRLAEDDYELKLTGFDEAGQPERAGSYYFTVLKQ